LEVIGAGSEGQIEETQRDRQLSRYRRFIPGRVFFALYSLALAASISIWFIAIRAPLWLDETGSYWQISGGFSKILSRQLISFPAYSYILWLSTKIIGSSEIALRVPSILAMLGAVYLLYLAARELFERDVAFIAVIVFCLHPIVIFESIDIRPYAFAALATNAAILILLRLRRSDSNWLAALLGLSAACILWFHFLFAVILPGLVLWFFVIKIRDRKTLWRQFGIAAAAFALAALPAIPELAYLFRTSKIHVYELAPNLLDLARILAPGWLLPIICVTVPVTLLVSSFTTRRRDSVIPLKRWHLPLCASLALIPVLILFGVSVGTSIHLFKASHELVAVPGIALCWAFIAGRIESRSLRLLYCALFLASTAFHSFGASPIFGWASLTSKHALEFVQKNASADNAPVLICSNYTESNYADMPLDTAKDSNYFTQLSYYRLSVPVVPLPLALNDEAMRVGSRFLQEAATKHERFLALAYLPSYRTLDWLAQSAAATHTVRKLGVFDGFEVLEFVPRTEAVASR
jgi:hypothetical protein